MPGVVDGVMFAHPERWSSQDDLTVDAQMYIKKASEVIHRTGDPHLKLRYRVRAHGRFENVTAPYLHTLQVSYARIQDSQGKFLEASLKYYQLSQAQVRGYFAVGSIFRVLTGRMVYHRRWTWLMRT